MSTKTNRSKSDYFARAAADMAEHLSVPPWGLRQKLALSCHILAREEHGSGIAGQITARGEATGTMWALPFDVGFEEIKASDFLLVDDDLNVLEGNGMPNPSNRFHLWIYRARPDVQCIIHTHPPYCSALSMIGEPLEPAHMDTSMFYDDCAYLAEWPGPPIGDEEGDIISTALGDKRAILLAHHGQLCACGTVEEAAVLALFIERAARLQLLARAAGEIRKIDPDIAKAAHDYRLQPEPIGATFHYLARRVLETESGCLD